MGQITDVPGVKVGHQENIEALTGCTVVLFEEGAVGGVDVRGSAPGTRETDLLNPTNLVEKVHGVLLCGEVGSKPCRSVSQGVECYSCLPKTAWPPTLRLFFLKKEL